MKLAPPHRLGLSRVELVVCLAVVLAVIALGLPALAAGHRTASISHSHANLRLLGLANVVYAADWNDRQPTFIDDEISSFGGNLAAAFNGYTQANGGYGDPANWHPAITLGWGVVPGDPTPRMFAYRCDGNMANASLTVPINIEGGVEWFGSFRLPNTRQFRQYVSTRFYDPVFYAPTDEIVYDIVEDYFDEPWEFVYTPPQSGFGDAPVWASYVYSPAAMLHPDVLRHPLSGGYQNPWGLNHGFESPSLSAALYPSLKTFMLEHHWLQNAPADPCNPAFEPGSYNGCEPYYFNHGMASEPVTLFYDLSVRFLPNTDVKAADDAAIKRTGFGLWSRDTAFGSSGYLNEYGYEEVGLSHHILTTDGIRGRDVTE